MKQTIKVADKPTADEIKATVEGNASKLDGITTYLESGGGILGNPEYGLEAIKGYLAELKNLVGNGKTNVANAITGKGVPTATDATFATLVKNIESIVTLMQGTQDANAAAPQILKGYSAYVKGAKVNGSINSLGAQTITPGTANKTIAANQYLSGVQTIAGDANLVAANIAKGKSIFGVAGNLEGLSGKNIFIDVLPFSKDTENKKYIIPPYEKYLDFNPDWVMSISRCSFYNGFSTPEDGFAIYTKLFSSTSSSYYYDNTIDNNDGLGVSISNVSAPMPYLSKSKKWIGTNRQYEFTYNYSYSVGEYPRYYKFYIAAGKID